MHRVHRVQNLFDNTNNNMFLFFRPNRINNLAVFIKYHRSFTAIFPCSTNYFVRLDRLVGSAIVSWSRSVLRSFLLSVNTNGRINSININSIRRAIKVPLPRATESPVWKWEFSGLSESYCSPVILRTRYTI